jgi:hypothetical protein
MSIWERNNHNGGELGPNTISHLNTTTDTNESKTKNTETERAKRKTCQRITLNW